MSTDATVEVGVAPATTLAADLRAAAEFIEQHPHVVNERARATVHLDSPWKNREHLERILEAFGKAAEVDTGSTLCTARLNVGHTTRIGAMFDRDALCTPRIEAGEVVYDLDPDAA